MHKVIKILSKNKKIIKFSELPENGRIPSKFYEFYAGFSAVQVLTVLKWAGRDFKKFLMAIAISEPLLIGAAYGYDLPNLNM